MKRQAKNMRRSFPKQHFLNSANRFSQGTERLMKDEMAVLVGGDVVIRHEGNAVLIGIGIGAVIGYIIGGPLGALEGAFWGGVLWSLWP